MERTLEAALDEIERQRRILYAIIATDERKYISMRRKIDLMKRFAQEGIADEP
jgi:hypothetical protein